MRGSDLSPKNYTKKSETIGYNPTRRIVSWQAEECATLYIKPGSPWENPFIESFNGTFRAECLNRWLFADGQEAQTMIELWRQEYNHHRPHRSLGYLPPAAFAEKFKPSLQLA